MENFGIVASPIYMIMMDFGKDHINKGGLHKCPYKVSNPNPILK
jgi:hypothetical protein